MSESEMDLDGTGVLGLFLFDWQNAVSSIITLTTIGTLKARLERQNWID